MRLRSYEAELLKQLKDPKEAAEYLNACLADSEDVFLLGLRNVVKARGSMKRFADETGLNRENLYRSLARKGNPKLSSISTMLDTLGIQLRFAAVPKQKKAA